MNNRLNEQQQQQQKGNEKGNPIAHERLLGKRRSHPTTRLHCGLEAVPPHNAFFNIIFSFVFTELLCCAKSCSNAFGGFRAAKEERRGEVRCGIQ
eukprot:gene6110-4392_t